MLISLLQLPVEGKQFEHQYADGELDTQLHEFTLLEAPFIKGRVKRAGMDVKLTGQLTTKIAVPCDRCLQDVIHVVDEPLSLAFADSKAETVRTGENEINDEELEFSYFEDDQLDIDQVIREQIEMLLPTRSLCRENCQGLCPQCGSDLNEETCQCAALVDPRWHALIDAKQKLEEPE